VPEEFHPPIIDVAGRLRQRRTLIDFVFPLCENPRKRPYLRGQRLGLVARVPFSGRDFDRIIKGSFDSSHWQCLFYGAPRNEA
jgi:hypothetical protein